MKLTAIGIVLSTLVLAQATDGSKKAEFEVASIRPAVQDDRHDSSSDRSLFRTHNITLKTLIARAYDVDVSQIMGGPPWLSSDGWDINAKIPAEFATQTRTKLPEMIQNLLADRFKLVIHRDPIEVSGYALVVTKKGPKMEPANPDVKDSSTNQHNQLLTATNVTMESFARSLSRNGDIGKLVIDKTGLTGGFNFKLEWQSEPQRLGPDAPPSTDDRPSIFTALQEQLGLKLESAKVPTLAVVIDHAEKPVGN